MLCMKNSLSNVYFSSCPTSQWELGMYFFEQKWKIFLLMYDLPEYEYVYKYILIREIYTVLREAHNLLKII